MRRLLLVSFAALAAAVCAAAAAAAPAPVRLTQVGGVRFPDRQFVLALPQGARVAADEIRLLENGKPVPNLSIVPARTAGRHAFGVVLAIDSSDSMRGKALAAARAAAITFVSERNPNQQVAVVFFNSRTHTAVRFTNDPATIVHALQAPVTTASGTHIYDAVVASAHLLRSAHIVSGSIVVLSDGSDTGSRASAAAAAAVARSIHARVFAIGLRSHAFLPATLRALADAAGGEYAEAMGTNDLTATYRAIGTELAQQYLVRYRSNAATGQRVSVTAAVTGSRGVARAAYVAPQVGAAPPTGFQRSLGQRFWQSPASVVLVSALIGLLVAFTVVAFARRGRGSVRQRVAKFVTIAPPDAAAGAADPAILTGRVLAGAERSFKGTRFWKRFEQQVELAELQLAPIQIASLTAVATILVALLAGAAAGPIGVVFALAVPLSVNMFVKTKLQRRRARFAEQLPDNLQVIASALRAGHSLVGALAVLAEDVAEPSQSEFRRVLADEQLGVPLEDSLSDVGRRMASRDLEQISVVAALQHSTGGNSAEVIDRVTETIRQRFELRRLVKTLTTQGRMSRWIVSLLPVVLFFVINLINPGYMRPLYEESAGRILLAFAALMVAAGSYVIKRIVNIKV